MYLRSVANLLTVLLALLFSIACLHAVKSVAMFTGTFKVSKGECVFFHLKDIVVTQPNMTITPHLEVPAGVRVLVGVYGRVVQFPQEWTYSTYGTTILSDDKIHIGLEYTKGSPLPSTVDVYATNSTPPVCRASISVRYLTSSYILSIYLTGQSLDIYVNSSEISAPCSLEIPQTYVRYLLYSPGSGNKIMFRLYLAYAYFGADTNVITSIVERMVFPNGTYRPAFIFDPTYTDSEGRLVDLANTSIVLTYSESGEYRFVLSERPFAYVIANFSKCETSACIAIPPMACIRVWNSTWSNMYCNLAPTYPYLIVTISAGTYHWSLGAPYTVDFAFPPRSISPFAVKIYKSFTVSTYYYATQIVPLENYGNVTTLSKTYMNISETTPITKPLSLEIETPALDLSKITKIVLLTNFSTSLKTDSVYRVAIYNPYSQYLKDIAVELELTDKNFGLWSSISCSSVISPSSVNFYFTDVDGRPLYYWVEYCNTTSKRMFVWVKIPSIPPHSYYIVVLHVGLEYTSYNNISKVAWWYNFANSINGWEKYGEGVVTLSTTVAIEDSGSIEKETYCDPNGGYIKIRPITWSSSNTTTGIAIIAYVKPENQPDCNYVQVGIGTVGTTVHELNYAFGVDGWSQMAITFRIPGSSATYLASEVALVRKGFWYRMYMYVSLSSSFLGLYNLTEGGKLGVSVSGGGLSESVTFSAFYVLGGRPYYVDMIAIFITGGSDVKVIYNVTSISSLGLALVFKSGSTSYIGFMVSMVRHNFTNAYLHLDVFTQSKHIVKIDWKDVGVDTLSNCLLNITYLSPSSSGELYITITCGGEKLLTYSTTFVSSGSLYLWVGTVVTSLNAVVTVLNNTTLTLSTSTSTVKYTLSFVNGRYMWVLGSGVNAVPIFVLFFTYSPTVVLMSNVTYSVKTWFAESSLSTTSPTNLSSTAVAYLGKFVNFYTFSLEKAFPVAPSLLYVTSIVPIGLEVSSNNVTVYTAEGFDTVVIFGAYSGVLTIRAVGVEGSKYSAYLITEKGTTSTTCTVGEDCSLELYGSDTPFLLAVKYTYPDVKAISISSSESISVLSLPPYIGYNSTFIAYIPAVIGIVNLTSNTLVDPYTTSLYVEFKSPSTYSTLGHVLFRGVNVIMSPAPSLDILIINATYYLDLAVFGGAVFDCLPALKGLPQTSISVTVTVPKLIYNEWSPPFYIGMIYDTGSYLCLVGSDLGYGSISASGDLYFYQLSVTVPAPVLGADVDVVLESVKTGNVEAFPMVKLTDSIYLEVTRTLGTIFQQKVPVQAPSKVPPPPAFTVPTLTIPKNILVLYTVSPLEQGLVVAFTVLGVVAYAVAKRRDMMKALLLAGIFMLVMGGAFIFWLNTPMWMIFLAGLIITVLTVARMLTRRIGY